MGLLRLEDAPFSGVDVELGVAGLEPIFEAAAAAGGESVSVNLLDTKRKHE